MSFSGDNYEFATHRALLQTTVVDNTSDRTVHHAMGLFITRVEQRLLDGQLLISHSRWHRKGLPPIKVSIDGVAEATLPLELRPWLQFWAPHRLAWWIAVLFIIGSACFASGGFASNWPQYVPSGLADSSATNMVFFVGSLFFTSAALLQLLEAINGDVADVGTSAGEAQRNWRWFAWKPHNAGYSASLIQFVGTLLFNMNTADAMLAELTWVGEEFLIWTPDAIGSVCFLAASHLALIEVSHRSWSFQPRQLSWWIVMINLLGSIAFMLAALFSFFLPSSGNAEWLWGANLFTLLGALCFLLASYLMIPELFGAARTTDTR